MIESIFTLRDGRLLSYSEWGDPGGSPVVLLHGSPGSRLFVPDDIPPGVRLITFNRSGYGTSSGRLGRTVLDAADDLAELLDLLNVQHAGIVAWSGGCPTGVAFGYRYPHRTTALALVSGPGPLDEVPGVWELLGSRRRKPAEWARSGDLQRTTQSIYANVEPFLKNPVAFLGAGRGPDTDIVSNARFRPMLEAQITEAFAHPDGVAQDLIAMWLPFGFALRDIRVRTVTFQGELDRDNHADMAHYANQIPGAKATVWPGLGHFGLLVRFPEVIAALVGPSAQV